VLKNAGLQKGVFVILFLMVSTTLFVTHRTQSAEKLPRESAVCLDCHDDKLETLRNTPHQILADQKGDNAAVVCTDCHQGSPKHYEDDPEEYPMVNPATADFAMTAQICATCHSNSHQQNMQERNPHPLNNVGCMDCHQIHGVVRAGLLKKEEVKLCYSCHTNVRGEFAQPYRHPISDKIIRCSDCHMEVARDKEPLSYARMDEACFQCHKYFQGPFPYEHQATIGWSTQEGGCMACHRPHGSSVPRMLNQPYESPDYSLCSQCHTVPGHNFNSRHGDEWAGMPCNDCHVDIHGSYTSRYFFSTALQSQGCFNTGCHQF
jgi:DmsE family decaheme c-type cytochrome